MNHKLFMSTTGKKSWIQAAKPTQSDMPEFEIDPETGKLKLEKDDGKSFSAGEHSLFVTDEMGPGNEVMIDAEGISALVQLGVMPPEAAQNTDGILVDMAGPQKYKHYDVWIGDFMTKYESSATCQNLNKLLRELSKANPEDKVYFHIDSHGGSIDEGLQFMYEARKYFEPENIATEVSSKAYSMGSMLMTIGDVRIGTEDGSIMLHDYAAGMGGQGQKIKDFSEHAEERFNSLTKSLYVDAGYMTNAEWERFKDGKEFWLSSEKAAKRGLLTHIILRSGNIVSAEDFLRICAGEPTEEEAAILAVTAAAEAEQAKAEKKAANAKKRASNKAKKEAEAKKATKPVTITEGTTKTETKKPSRRKAPTRAPKA
jgi:ATP-dependent protease ClpP protease subunit